MAQCLGFFLGVCVLVPGVMGQRTNLAMRSPVPASGVVDLGAMPASEQLAVTVYLAPSADRQAALVDYLKAVQTPGDAAYHAWLTPVQFGQTFGATAEQIAAVTAFAQGSGLNVQGTYASGRAIVVSGSVAQMEAAFAPKLHSMMVGPQLVFANTAAVSVPVAVAADVLSVGGLSTVPVAQPMMVGSDGAAGEPTKDGLAALSVLAEANTSRVVTLSTASCLEDVDAATQAAMQLVLRQASAEGMTVLAATGCGARGSAGFPSVLSEATSVALSPGIAVPATASLIEARPSWQMALGLPADGLRHEPDVTVGSLTAFSQVMVTILNKQPAPLDGSQARLGSINGTLYELAVTPGLYTQADGAAAGTWEAATGLGLVDLQTLVTVYPHGSLSDNVSVAVSNGGFVTHGQSLTFSSTVSDTSGQGNGAVPSGTVTFATNTGVALGSGVLAGGSTSVSYNALPGGTYTVQASYSGDGTYASNTSISTGFNVGAEAAQVTAAAGSCSVGSTCNLTVTVKSTSGVGTPTGTVSAVPQGSTDTTTYTATLSGSGGTATATIPVAAVKGGASVFTVNCTTSASFTCYSPQQVTAQVATGIPAMTVTASPVAPTAGQTDSITAVVSGNGGVYPTPTGNVDFYDNGTKLGPATLNGGTASYTTAALTGSSHSFSATYGGDNNYSTVTAAAGATTTTPASATTLAVSVAPNPPVGGSPSTITAVIAYTLTNSTAPSGTVNFYVDGVLMGSEPVSNGQAVYPSTTLSSTTSHQYSAVYNGDANYLASTSPTVTTAAATGVSTTTTFGVSPNPPVAGSATTLTATVTPASGTATPSGTVGFYEDGALLSTSTLVGGIATFQSTTLSSTTTHTFYAVYSGDTTYKTSTSATVATSSSTATLATTTALTVTPNPPVSGSTTTLTATIGYTGTATPTGTAVFYQDGVALATGTVSGNTASVTSTQLSSKTAHSFSAIYSGDSTYKTSTSPTVSSAATSTTATTTTTVAAASSTVASGGTDTLTATIAPSSIVNGAALTGTVTFSSAQGTLCSATVSANSASCVATLTTSGVQSITATYSGDTNYAGSASTAAAAVTVGAATSSAGVLTASASPSTAMYGNTVILSSTLTPTTAVGGGPTGTVTFMLVGATTTSYTVSLVPSGAASATATYSIPAPIPGTYVITATCTSSNVTCTGLSATASLTTVKGNTVTTLTAAPTNPVAGQTTVFTATVAPAAAANAGAVAPTGTVTFYVNGVATIVTLTNGTATFSTVLTATTGNFVTAIYSGDTNWNASTSSQLNVVIAPVPTTGTLTSSSGTYLYGANVLLTDTVAVAPTTLTPYPVSPTGSVTFYDLYNGQTSLLGTASLTQIVLGTSVAQFSTTGLRVGTHNITALFNATTTYGGSSASYTINIQDYAVTFSPSTLSVSQGSGGAAIATITSENGFSGQVVLACTPPPGSGITCGFSPTVITASGTSVLSVQTTAAKAMMERPVFGRDAGVTLAAASLGSLLLGLLLPRRRRVPALLAVLLAVLVAAGSSGCTTQGILNTGSTVNGTGTSGTPLGTQLLNITTQGTDGITTVRHDSQYQVTVQ